MTTSKNNEQFRFLINGEWTSWLTDADDLSFLMQAGAKIQAMETKGQMSKADYERLFGGSV